MGGVMPEAPGLFTMLGRGARRRCPRCAAGDLFTSWFRMRERCPGCRLRFEGPPQEGFFLGAFTVNLCVTFGVLLVAVFAYIGMSALNEAPPLLGFVVVSGAGCVVVPIVSYPFARCVWVAFELAMHNMDDSLRGGRGSPGHARGAGR